MPSNQCNENVKLRHRNPVTATATVSLPVGEKLAFNNNNNTTLSEENPSQEKHFEDSCSKHFGFFSELSASKCERYMTHRSQSISESSDASQINEVESFDDCCENIKQTLCTTTAAMRAGDFQRQPSISQIKSSTMSNPRCNGSRAFGLFMEIAIRLVLLASFIQMERITPFKRIIHPEEVWLYKNPVSKEYVSATVIILSVIFAPIVLTTGIYLLSRDKKDYVQANYAFTLGIVLNGFVTSLLKISVGRPRPDFFYRCYPDGVMLNDSFDHCTGDPRQVNEGRKSFPSGHSSMAFASFGFMAYYLASKLHIFNERGRGRTWRLCVSIAPLIVAAEVAISRTCDYRHHWQDVTVGSIIGICISYLCYRQYFPSIFARNCHRSYSRDTRITTNQVNCVVAANDGTEDVDENEPLIGGEKDNKWI